MIPALVLTHGQLGAEFVRVVELFVGPIADLEAATNDGLSADYLAGEVRRWLTTAAGPALIFVDEAGGSCATAARIAAADHGSARVICGVNLAMLLVYSSCRDSHDLSQLVRRLLTAGREAIVEVGTER